MTEKNLTPTKNTLATVALMLSIIGLVLSFFVIGIPLLVLSLLLGIIALFKAPRGKARASIILSIIPLGLFGWLIGMISRMLISATVEFTDWMQTEIKGNATMEAVFAQPGFRLFTEQKVRETIGRIDRGTIPTTNSIRGSIEGTIDYIFETLKTETPIIVDARIAQYGLPTETKTELTNSLPTNPLANTTRTLQTLDEQPVSGTYTLHFTETAISTQLCNVIGGNYTLNEHIIKGNFFQTKRACTDAELTTLENAFQLDGATFTIASTRMIGDNAERLIITTLAGHTFLYTNSPAAPETIEQNPSLYTPDIQIEDIKNLTNETTSENDVIQDVKEILNELDQDNS